MASSLTPESIMRAIEASLQKAVASDVSEGEAMERVTSIGEQLTELSSLLSSGPLHRWTFKQGEVVSGLKAKLDECFLSSFTSPDFDITDEISSLAQLAHEACTFFGPQEEIEKALYGLLTAERKELVSKTHSVLQEGEVDKAAVRISDREVVIAGPVLDDGVGDFFNMLSMAEALHDAYPGQPIRLIMKISHDHFESKKDLFKVPPYFSLEAAFLGDGSKEVELCGEKIFLMPEETMKRINEAAYCIEYVDYQKGPSILPAPNLILGEPGCHSCGLYAEDLGLLIPEVGGVRPLTSLKDAWLSKLLTDLLSDPTSSLGMLYFNAVGFVPTKLATIISCMPSALHPEKSSGDVVLLTNQSIREGGGIDLNDSLVHLGFSQIVYERRSGQEIVLLEGKGERSLHVVEAFPLEHEDFLTVLGNTTTPIVGCSGDQSLAETFAFLDPLPFYQIRAHKKFVWADLINLAREKLGSAHPYTLFLGQVQLFNEDAGSMDSLKSYLSSPVCYEGAQILHKYIVEEKNALTKLPLLFVDYVKKTL